MFTLLGYSVSMPTFSSQGITEVVVVHPLRTMNMCTRFHVNLIVSLQSKPKWCTDQPTKRLKNAIHRAMALTLLIAD